jgi:hypothetical protein
MFKRDPTESTIRFTLWPYLVLLQGTSSSVGSLLDQLYEDPDVPRDEWSVHHPYSSRKVFADEIRKEGAAHRRLGIGARSKSAVDAIKHKAKSVGVECTVMSTATTGTEHERIDR